MNKKGSTQRSYKSFAFIPLFVSLSSLPFLFISGMTRGFGKIFRRKKAFAKEPKKEKRRGNLRGTTFIHFLQRYLTPTTNSKTIESYWFSALSSQFSTLMYRAFHRSGQAKFAYGGPILGSSQFLLLPHLPQEMTLASNVVKIDSEIIILLH